MGFPRRADRNVNAKGPQTISGDLDAPIDRVSWYGLVERRDRCPLAVSAGPISMAHELGCFRLRYLRFDSVLIFFAALSHGLLLSGAP